jgi:hypothetical protein
MPKNIAAPTPITINTKSAGIEASAHFTMNTTIEPNGISMSVTTTSDTVRIITGAWYVAAIYALQNDFNLGAV